MKTKNIILVAAMALSAAALMAFTVMPNSTNPDEPEKTLQQTDVANDEESDTGALCPCGELRCGICGGPVEWTSQAYVKKRSKCSACNGTGYTGDGKYVKKEICKYCDGTGIYVEWGAGCRCNHCSQGFKQPNDC